MGGLSTIFTGRAHLDTSFPVAPGITGSTDISVRILAQVLVSWICPVYTDCGAARGIRYMDQASTHVVEAHPSSGIMQLATSRMRNGPFQTGRAPKLIDREQVTGKQLQLSVTLTVLSSGCVLGSSYSHKHGPKGPDIGNFRAHGHSVDEANPHLPRDGNFSRSNSSSEPGILFEPCS